MVLTMTLLHRTKAVVDSCSFMLDQSRIFIITLPRHAAMQTHLCMHNDDILISAIIVMTLIYSPYQ